MTATFYSTDARPSVKIAILNREINRLADMAAKAMVACEPMDRIKKISEQITDLYLQKDQVEADAELSL